MGGGLGKGVGQKIWRIRVIQDRLHAPMVRTGEEREGKCRESIDSVGPLKRGSNQRTHFRHPPSKGIAGSPTFLLRKWPLSRRLKSTDNLAGAITDRRLTESSFVKLFGSLQPNGLNLRPQFSYS